MTEGTNANNATNKVRVFKPNDRSPNLPQATNNKNEYIHVLWKDRLNAYQTEGLIWKINTAGRSEVSFYEWQLQANKNLSIVHKKR